MQPQLNPLDEKLPAKKTKSEPTVDACLRVLIQLVKDQKLDLKLQKSYLLLIETGYKHMSDGDRHALQIAFYGPAMQDALMSFITLKVASLPAILKPLKKKELVSLCFIICGNHLLL
jgi:hypothetical protein